VADKLHPLHALLKNGVKLCSEQAKQKQRHDKQSKACNLKLGDTVWIAEVFMAVLSGYQE